MLARRGGRRLGRRPSATIRGAAFGAARCLALSALLWSAGAAIAAPPMRFETLSVEEGLSQSVVNCIIQDSRGYLWVGTQGGLNRYDGYEITVYRHQPQEPDSLSHDWVVSLAEGPDGDIWIGTEGGGLARWRATSGHFEAYRHVPGDAASLSDDRVMDLAWDAHRRLWIATRASGLDVLDPTTGDIEHIRHEPANATSLVDDNVRTVVHDRQGGLWIGTLGGLAFLDASDASTTPREFVRYQHDPDDPRSLSDNRVRAVVEDQHGTIWVGTHAGLNRLDRVTGTFDRFVHDPEIRSSLSHDWIRDLFTDRDGRLWIGTDGGLNLYHPRSGDQNRHHFVSYTTDAADPYALRSDQIVDIYQDRGGILWVGTIGGGLSKWNPVNWSFTGYRPGGGEAGTSNMVFAISQDPQGGVWIGTFGGLERIERNPTGEVVDRRTYVHDPTEDTSLSDDRVTALRHDRSGVLWVGTFGGGLNVLDPSTGQFTNYSHVPDKADSLSVDAVTSIHEGRDGRLWVGTLDGGLHLHRGAGSFVRFRHDPADPASLAHDRVMSIAEDDQGRLWLATDGAGLDRFEPDGSEFVHYRYDEDRPESLASDELMAVHADAHGRLWIGTKGLGLNLLTDLETAPRDSIFRHYTREHGLPDDTVWGILSDSTGTVWVSTSRGLSRFDPNSESFKNYDTGDGLLSPEFNMGARFRGLDGELFFGGVAGLDFFFPDRVHRRQAPPQVILTELTTFNQPLELDHPAFATERVDLTYQDRFLSFEFAALDFAAPQRNRYRYRLSDLDDTWIDLGHERRVTFPSLAPGLHRLQIQAANSDGIWNTEGTSVSIRVAPAPWQSWWARTLYFLAASAAVLLVVRSQNRRIERERKRVQEREKNLQERELLVSQLEHKNSELERFNYTVSHDLRTPLVTIKGFLGYLKRDLKDGNRANVDKDIQRISDAADRMSNLLSDLLQFAIVGRHINPPESIPLHELAYEARELLSGLLTEQGVELEIARDLPVVSGDRIRLREMFQNLVENAVKYMGAQDEPRIEIGCRRGDEEVIFVRDNGRGIEPQYHEKIFELFERLDVDHHGTGIGLALVKRIVEFHGGRVWVESEGLGHGSTFCFTIGEATVRPDENAAGALEDPTIWF